MPELDKAQMQVIDQFMESILKRIEAGDLALKDGFATIKTAMASFDPSDHLHAIAFMKEVLAAQGDQ